MLVHVVRLLGYAVQSVSVGAGNWFGAAGYSPSKGTYKRADVVLPHYLGPGRHMFLDTAVACPAAGGALNAQPSSAEASGVAASLRAEKKTAKYAPLAAGVSSQFRPAVVERFGACCDPLVGLINMLCGDGDCDALRADDYTFSASSLGILAHDLHGVATSLWHGDLGCGNGGSGYRYGCAGSGGSTG